jgi:hypothetical protein
MFEIFTLIAMQILSIGGFKVTEIPRKIYQELLTALQSILEYEVIMIPGLIKLVKLLPGCLIVDDTSNPKYGMKHLCKILKLLPSNGFTSGFKIILFLWEAGGKRYPIGFALWHQGTKSLNELFLEGLSQLRNRFELKPKSVSFDAAYMTDIAAKRLTDYGWPFVSRFKKNRTLSGSSIRRLIPRGYGETSGKLKHGEKVKVFRRAGFFLLCNRMAWSVEKALSEYKIRWKIEETFRILKSCLNLKGCQQHSMQAQALYTFVCLILFSCVEFNRDITNPNDTPYKTFQNVISGQIKVEDILVERFFRL